MKGRDWLAWLAGTVAGSAVGLAIYLATGAR